MFFIAGIHAKVKPVGVALHCRCPACGQTADLHLVKKYLTPHLFFIPTVHLRVSYMATCGRCAGVMELNKQTGDAFCRNPSTPVRPEDLQMTGSSRSALRCPSCSLPLRGSERFCPGCGKPLDRVP